MEKNYRQKFFIPDIPTQPYPVYAISESGRIVNFKNMVYPNSKSIKRFTRLKQLRKRSKQALLFDFLIRINYWNPLTVYREFPVIIENDKRMNNQTGLFYLLDYYFPELKLAVELDSDLHSKSKDNIRDEYLKKVCGIRTFRIIGLDNSKTQSTRFMELVEMIKKINPIPNPKPLIFTSTLFRYLTKKGM